MKFLIALALMALSSTSFAYYVSYYEDMNEEDCPGLVLINKGDTALCADNADAKKILATSRSNSIKLDKMPRIIDFLDVVELNIWPDDSTSMIYAYSSILRDSKGVNVGYLVYHAYTNSEMESMIGLETRYNLEGRLVSVTVK